MAAMNPRVRAALDLMRVGQRTKARELLTEVLAVQPDDVDALIALAEAARRDGELAVAGPAIHAALSRDPENQWGLRVAAYVWSDYGNHEPSVAVARRAVDLGPLLAENHRTLAAMLRLARRPVEALAAADTAVELSPDDPDTHATRAGVLRALGRSADADAAYREVLRLDPQRAGAVHDLAVTQLESGRFGVRKLETIVRGLVSAAAMDTSLGGLARRNVAVAVTAGLIRLRRWVFVAGCLMMVLWVASWPTDPSRQVDRYGQLTLPRYTWRTEDLAEPGEVTGPLATVATPTVPAPTSVRVPVAVPASGGRDASPRRSGTLPPVARWLGTVVVLLALATGGWWVGRMAAGANGRSALAIAWRTEAVRWLTLRFLVSLALLTVAVATGEAAWLLLFVVAGIVGGIIRRMAPRRRFQPS